MNRIGCSILKNCYKYKYAAHLLFLTDVQLITLFKIDSAYFNILAVRAEFIAVYLIAVPCGKFNCVCKRNAESFIRNSREDCVVYLLYTVLIGGAVKLGNNSLGQECGKLHATGSALTAGSILVMGVKGSNEPP